MNGRDRRARIGGALFAAMLVALLGWMAPARNADAQTPGAQPTAIGMAAPPSIELGETVTVKAKLVGAGGAPVTNKRVDFTTTGNFLNTTSDMVLAAATTDAAGVATGQFVARRSGSIAITAVFAGDGGFAGAKAGTQVMVTGDRQLYQQQAGVALPGLNAPPDQNSNAVTWPRWVLSGWPIAVVLLLVWSLYGTAVVFIGEIAAQGGEPDAPEQQLQTEAG